MTPAHVESRRKKRGKEMPSATYSCSIVGKSSGTSAVAASAYHAAEKIYNRESGYSYDYTRKAEGVVSKGIEVPENHADWMTDRAELWNRVEQNEREVSTRPESAQYCRRYIIGLPSELSQDENIDLVKNFIHETYTSKGMIADWAIHLPSENGDDRNLHVHIDTTLRSIVQNPETGEYEFGNKNRDWNKPLIIERDGEKQKIRPIEIERKEWEKAVNREYERKGLDVRLNMNSLEKQGIQKEPQQHMGHGATELVRKGEEADRQRYASQDKTLSLNLVNDTDKNIERNEVGNTDKGQLEKEIKQLEREYTIAEKMESIIDDPTRTRETVKYYQNEDNKDHNEITEQAVKDTIYKQGIQYAELYKKLEEEQKKEATQERAEKIRNVQTKGIEIAKINNKGDRIEMLEYANRESFKNKGFEQELQNRKAEIAQQRADAERERIKAEVEEIAKLQEKERRERERNQERGMSR